ncbi:hypothetical protein Cali_206 [Mycobacterium phage Cali]|uniref:Uncharacterized protein n=45 Tax=Bixzunavirus TaxID=680114 RepID=Q853A0_BPMBZ|nr:gp203 [Mycobacterium phage Bxz1]YP_002224206.1 hypothetical protein SCOTTMCG_207 [Mycobacterium phage ScottMcG]YP_002224428.1 gp207 [Mycobacterium phage Spud]YP_002224650.1 gp206 [Mycobacterium phage Cali]YP_002224870.1 gp205 [Mycobacterium phage Rizal]YP_003347851.1 hypothetical protein ET08_201 [Mycobacterium phage ET08]YP_008060985.1 hypothetical protein M181_gp142 [Mycobacterium phage Gizmo]YP_008061442.1 hypothetical protein M180_gp138 [Mycobacterium phage ArcherS7]YP_008061673.1 hy
MRVYVTTSHTAVLEVFVNERDAKVFKANYEDQHRGETCHIQPRELRTDWRG